MLLVHQGYCEDADSVVVRLQKRLMEERRLKIEAESMAAHFEDSARQANERLEKAMKLFEMEKAILTKRAEKDEKNFGPVKEKYATLIKTDQRNVDINLWYVFHPTLSMCWLMILVAAYCTFFCLQGERVITL